MDRVYKIEYEDIDFNEHIKYFRNRELAVEYATKIINEYKGLIENNTLNPKAYEKERFDIRLRKLAGWYKRDDDYYIFLACFDDYTTERKAIGYPYIDFTLGYSIFDKEDNYYEHERDLRVRCENIDVITSLDGVV